VEHFKAVYRILNYLTHSEKNDEFDDQCFVVIPRLRQIFIKRQAIAENDCGKD
jgi:hypothetical protein